MAVLRRERALIRQKPDQTSITTSLTMTSVSQWSRPHRVMTVTMLNFSLWLSNQYHKAGPLRFVCGLAWSEVGPQYKREYSHRNSTSVKCVASRARVKPKSQQARGRERNAECDPSWADHYYGQGTHDTAASMWKQSQVSIQESSAPLTLTSSPASLSCPVSTQPSLSLLPLTAATATRHQQPSDWLSCCQINQDHAPVTPLTYTSCFNNNFNSRTQLTPHVKLINGSIYTL